MSDMMAGFAALEDEFYPGSKQLRRDSPQVRRERRRAELRAERGETSWDAKPTEIWYQGVRYEVFPIGALAKAMNRDSVTIRAWMRKGWLPRNGFQTPAVYGSLKNASRRLWTRTQIDRIAQIAKEEGLLEENPVRIQQTSFTQRVFSEWKELRWR
jgi:hypothetical protein